MKVLIYSTGGQGAQEGCNLDEAIEQVGKGNDVFFLSCDDSIGGCMENPEFNPIICAKCRFFQKRFSKRYLPKSVEHHWVKEYMNEISEKDIPIFSYKTVSELKSICFRNVEIGMGALSSYITLTRNLNPLIDQNSHLYFDALLLQQVKLTLIVEKLQEKYKFDLLVFHNGRFAQYKPLLNIAQFYDINFVCTETLESITNQRYKNYFYNDIPHCISANQHNYDVFWNSWVGDTVKREQIGRSFFERRRDSQPAGDVVYTSQQKKGVLPEYWDEKKENIVIFNSSEDEFCAISKEYDNAALFPSQLTGIKTIVEHYQKDPNKHFYLRVHPNLMKVGYKYHLDIYKLDYPNLTVIPADSIVSTYSIMDAANKIIVFGSTIGIEAVYWRKPVICLAAAFYKLMNIVYLPHTEAELWDYINTPHLSCLYNDEILRYGFYYMSESHEKTRFVNINWKVYRWGKIVFKSLVYQKILGSNLLYIVIQSFFKHVLYKFGRSVRLPILEDKSIT